MPRTGIAKVAMQGAYAIHFQELNWQSHISRPSVSTMIGSSVIPKLNEVLLRLVSRDDLVVLVDQDATTEAVALK